MTAEVARPRGPEDWQAMRDVCCETADSGEPIDRARWAFFSEYWIRPYERFEPDWAYAALDGGRVVGYLTGCPDTVPFVLRRTLLHRPLLLGQVLLCRWGWTEDVRRFLNPWMRVGRKVRFGLVAYADLLRFYPAHLHVNVRASHRGTGLGRRLMERYFEDLRGAGVSGVHLFCGPAPAEFYRKTGFEPKASIWVDGKQVYAFARRLL